jgi:hypothetical protein
MTALLHSERACSSTDPTRSRCTSLQTLQGTLFVSSWLRNWVRRGVLDSWERLRSVVPANLLGEAIHG